MESRLTRNAVETLAGKCPYTPGGDLIHKVRLSEIDLEGLYCLKGVLRPA